MAASRHVVIDNSVVLKWVLPEPGRCKALALLDEYETGQTDLIAPRLLMEECARTLQALQTRRFHVSGCSCGCPAARTPSAPAGR